MSFSEHLAALMPMQALAAALVLLILIGWRGAQAAGRWASGGMTLVALGLALLHPAVSGWLPSLGLLALSAGLSALWWALAQWLRPSPQLRPLMLALPPLIGGVYALLHGNPALARNLAHLLLGVQFAVLAWVLAQPNRGTVVQGLNQRRWRLLGLAGVAPLVAASLWRALAGVMGADAPAELALALAAQLALLLALPVLLLAWRGETEAELARLAQTDGLTGLMDAPAFAKRSVDMFSMARRYQEPLALMVLEIDSFVALTEEHGQEMGDRALALFASCLQAQMRLGDVTGRLAGQAFGVMMARCLPEGPQALDLRLRTALAERAPQELGMSLSYSAGWGKLRPGDRNLADLQRRAETALYEAKHAGSGLLMAEPGVAE